MQPRRSARPSFLLVAVAASAHVVRAQWQGADFVCPRNLSNEPDSPRKFTTPYRYTHQWTKMWLDERSDKACGVMNTHLYTTMISDTSVSPTCTRCSLAEGQTAGRRMNPNQDSERIHQRKRRSRSNRRRTTMAAFTKKSRMAMSRAAAKESRFGSNREY
eukprot:TRINITY_DN12486_c0_g1_i4.p1 TRINITY_DN12486_c0_g1~~TRINITY_DN12486_c0_g1_i4.p1  ORF type:complete len:160 (-),score=18.66 TRINITY_DN12486_c0_g1_i4:7-486(-)